MHGWALGLRGENRKNIARNGANPRAKLPYRGHVGAAFAQPALKHVGLGRAALEICDEDSTPVETAHADITGRQVSAVSMPPIHSCLCCALCGHVGLTAEKVQSLFFLVGVW